MNDPITVETTIQAPRERVWSAYSDPEAVKVWNAASPDWHTPSAINEVRPGGMFNYRMEAKDGSEGFDLVGTYTEVVAPVQLNYTLGDGRKVESAFSEVQGGTQVAVRFEPEHENSREMQAGGWQAILDNFKKYVEQSAAEEYDG